MLRTPKGVEQSPTVIKKQFEDQEMLWFPVMMGIATKAEMDKATMAEIQLLNEVANKNITVCISKDPFFVITQTIYLLWFDLTYNFCLLFFCLCHGMIAKSILYNEYLQNIVVSEKLELDESPS